MYTDNSSSAFIRRMKSRTLVGARALNPGLVPGRNSDATGGFMTALDAGRRVEVVPELAEAVANLYSTVPDAPTGVTAIAGIRQAVVSFAAPLNDGRSPITEYTVTSSPGGFTASGTASPITVTGLENGTAYTFTVVATNKMGNSVPSEPSSVATTFSVPSAPRNVSAVAGIRQAIVSFDPPSNNGGSPITSYTVTSSPGGLTASGSASPITVTGLANGVDYTFTVVATNNVGSSIILGQSAMGQSLSVRTFNVPSAPTIFSVTENTSGIASFSFTPPDSDGGLPITNYKYSVNGGSTFIAISPADITSPVNIGRSYPSGTIYGVLLLAVNDVGDGIHSPPFFARNPGAPTGVSATPGNRSATISFTPPVDDGGSPITAYTVISPGNSSIVAFGQSSPITVTGLTNGTPYTFKVRATTSLLLNSPDSVASASVTPYAPVTVPAAPTALSGVGGDKAIYVLFTAGNNGGSAITNYEYSIDGGNTFVACSPAQISSPIVIADPSLENGTPYTVALKAVNAAGAGEASATTTVTPTVNTLTQTANRLIELDASNSSSYPGSGTTWTNLRSGGSYSATLVNSPTFENTNGGILSCREQIIGYTTDTPPQPIYSYDYIEIADAAAIRATVGGAITAQIWAKVDPSVTNGDGLISKQHGSGIGKDYDGFRLSVNTNNSFTLGMNGSSVNGIYTTSPNLYSKGDWALYTIVIRFGGGTANPNYIYVSPHRVFTQSNTETGINYPNAPLRLAQGIQEGNSFCPCDIGAFYYYNTALSQEDIIRNYDATKARFGL